MGLDPSVSTKLNCRAKSLCFRIGIQSPTSRRCKEFLKIHSLSYLSVWIWPCLVQAFLLPENQVLSALLSFQGIFSSPFAQHYAFRGGFKSFLCTNRSSTKHFFLNSQAVFLSVRVCQQSWYNTGSLQATFKRYISDPHSKCLYTGIGVLTEQRRN